MEKDLKPMNISLRHFNEGDCDFIKQHFKSEPLQLISEFNTLNYNDLFFEMFAISTEFGLVGHASLYAVKDDKTAVSLGIIIDEEYQGKRIGSKICDILFDNARRLGYAKARAQARQDNTASLNLIKKKEFILLGESISKKGSILYNFEKSLN